uniref:WD_REPEATS_REGION domain-containing protein n=1 Tax=Haemonchus contortus TaxID=6289 RepID=A0A7I4YLM1_HAECO
MAAVSRRPKDGNLLDSLSFATPVVESVRQRKDFSQQTFAKLRKVAFLPHSDRLIWLGYSEGRCVALWKRCDDASEVVEPFDELFRLELDVDPSDLCAFSSELFCVSLSSGYIFVFNSRNDELVKVKEFAYVHGKGNSRVLCEFDSNSIISGSSNGSLAKVDIESGNVILISKGNSGVRSVCTLSGGSLLASGHSSGHVLIWDCRAKPTKPSVVCVPSKRRLDAVTTLTTHPAHASLISFGTDLGTVGFCDVRGVTQDLVTNSFDVTTATVTQVSFHPECGDHLVCASADGSLVHWDVSSVTTSNVSSGTRQSPWLSDSLSQAVELDTLRCPSFGAVNGFSIKGTTVVAAIDMCMLYSYENVSFPIGSGSAT